MSFVGFVSLLKDEFILKFKDVPIINWLPSWPWYVWTILTLLFLLGCLAEGTYRRFSALEEEIERIKTPKILIEHASQDIGPIQVTTTEQFRIEFTQYRIRLINQGAVPIPGVEMFCEDFSVLVQQPEDYTVLFGGGLHPQTLTPFAELPAGVLREIVEKDIFYGGVTGKRIEIQAYSRTVRQSVKGREFLITLRGRGETAAPSLPKSYRFGDRDGHLFFEEYHDATNS